MNKKSVNFKTKNGIKVTLTPTYRQDKDNQTLCDIIEMKIGDKQYFFNYLDWHMFCYMIGNEEQRLKLANYQSRKIREIPYEVEFKLSLKEKMAGVVTRRIVLPVDEALLHVKRNEKFKKMVKQEIASLSKTK